MNTITTAQQEPAVPYVQRVAQIICTGLYPEAHAAGKTLGDFPKATRENLLTIAEAILVDTTTEAVAAQRYAWWVTGRDELDGLAPVQLIIGGALDTAEGTPLEVDAHQRRHFLKPWRERLALLLQLLVLPQHEVGASDVFALSRSWSGAELEAAMGFPNVDADTEPHEPTKRYYPDFDAKVMRESAFGAYVRVDASATPQCHAPMGWKLVPTIPTLEMLNAGSSAARDAGACPEVECWDAMLDAAPMVAPSQVPDGWLWMTHPDRNDGHPIPVRLVRDEDDDSLWYVPFDETACEFEWSERDPDWQVVSHAQPAALANTAQADYEGAFRAASADMGAVITLLGFDSHPGIDSVLRRITELILAGSAGTQLEEK